MTPVPHDFRKPIRLPALWHNRLSGWFRGALAQSSKAWEKQFGPGVEAVYRDLNVAFAHDAVARLPDGVIGYEVLIGAPGITTLLAMPRSLMLGLIGILLGSTEGPAEDRALTLVEENLADYLQTECWLPHFRDTWPGDQLVAWQLSNRDPQPQCTRKFPAADVLIVLDFTVRGPWGESQASWLFPQKGLLEAIDNGAMKTEAIPEKTLAARREALVQALPLQVNVALGGANLTLSDLSNLRVGDVVLLDQRTTESITALSGGRPVFQCQPGRQGSWLDIQIDNTRV
ncbi:MAG: FliM/FliN family flagellar motor switch protein, partial [Planctomycetota bacterium]